MWLLVFGIIAIGVGFVVFFGAPYVPTLSKSVREGFDAFYPLSKTDHLVDLGSGDGIVLLEAAKRGARATGIELHPLLVAISRFRTRRYRQRVDIRLGNMWHVELPQDTTVVYVFVVSRDIKKLERTLSREATRIGHGFDVISFGFQFPDRAATKSSDSHFLYRFSP